MPYVDKVKSVKKTRGFPNRGERYGAKYENGVAYLLSYTVSVEKLWTHNTRIIHDVWRLLILSNEEKRMIMKILRKEWFIWKFWKKGGSREKWVGGNEIHAPCACDFNISIILYMLWRFKHTIMTHYTTSIAWGCIRLAILRCRQYK